MDHGGFSQSDGTLLGAEVMIYNGCTPGSGEQVTITGGTFNLTAPTDGTYQGVMIFQARDAGNVPGEISGAGKSRVGRAASAPGSPVTVTGADGATVGSLFIGDTVTVTGSGPFNVDWAGAPPPAKRDIRLTE